MSYRPCTGNVTIQNGVQFTLPNGLFVVLIEDHEVPTVKGQLLMRGGQRASPEDKVGM